MDLLKIRGLLVAAGCLAAGTASAQSSYVAAAVGSDVSRFNATTFNETEGMRVDGAALTLAVRAGTVLGELWGIEFEFVYPSGNSRERIQDSPLIENPTSQQAQTVTWAALGPVGVTPQFQVGMERHNPAADAAAWRAHNVRGGMQLRYLAGVAIHRFAQVNSVAVVPQRGLSVSSDQIGEREEVSYGVGPMAGIEARWMPRGRLFVTTGVRLHGFSGGWILRPSAGAGWSF